MVTRQMVENAFDDGRIFVSSEVRHAALRSAANL